MAASLPYHEPDIVTILIQSSFLLALNGVNWICDRALYCGLVGQVFLGVAWGAPGGKWLSDTAQETFVQLGYLGLILLVYEGECWVLLTDELSLTMVQAACPPMSRLSKRIWLFRWPSLCLA